MVWLITQKSRAGDLDIFFSSFSKTGRWWSYKLPEGMLFQERQAAENLLAKLKYNCPRIVSLKEAEKLVASRKSAGYTSKQKKNYHDRPVPPIRRQVQPAYSANPCNPWDGLLDDFEPAIPVHNHAQRRPRQLSWLDDESDHEMGHLIGLDGWGAGGG